MISEQVKNIWDTNGKKKENVRLLVSGLVYQCYKSADWRSVTEESFQFKWTGQEHRGHTVITRQSVGWSVSLSGDGFGLRVVGWVSTYAEIMTQVRKTGFLHRDL